MRKLIHVLALLLTLSAPVLAADEDSHIGNVAQKPSDKAVLVILNADKSMQALRIKVAHVSDGLPLVCFRDPDKQTVSCFVVNVKTGQVIFIPLATDTTAV